MTAQLETFTLLLSVAAPAFTQPSAARWRERGTSVTPSAPPTSAWSTRWGSTWWCSPFGSALPGEASPLGCPSTCGCSARAGRPTTNWPRPCWRRWRGGFRSTASCSAATVRMPRSLRSGWPAPRWSPGCAATLRSTSRHPPEPASVVVPARRESASPPCKPSPHRQAGSAMSLTFGERR